MTTMLDPQPIVSKSKRLITPERLKMVLSVLAVLFLALYAWQTKNVGDVGWAIAAALWFWPEKEETKP